MTGMKNLLRIFLMTAFVAGLLYPSISRAEESPESLKKIVAAMLEAYGGKDALSGVKSVIARGAIIDFIKDMQGEYARYYARPQKLRIEIMADKGGEVRILEGERGWRGSPAALSEVRQAPLQAMIYQYTYLDLPMGLTDGSYKVGYGGKKDFRGREVEVLLIEPKGAPIVRIYVDPQKRLILRAASDFSMGMALSELSTEYEDFRVVGKVLFPFRLVNYAGDMRLSVISLSEIQLNIDIPKERFSPGKSN